MVHAKGIARHRGRVVGLGRMRDGVVVGQEDPAGREILEVGIFFAFLKKTIQHCNSQKIYL